MSNADQPDLRHCTVLVTGAGDGLGAALARGAAEAGAEVVLLGRTVRKLEAVYDALTAAGAPEPAIYPLDLEGASPDDYAELAERVARQCGRLDGVIHAAAILGPQSPIEQIAPLEWARVLQVNLTAPMLLTQALLPLLRAAPAPALLFLGEDAARAYRGAYGVSKSGLRALASMLEAEVAEEAGLRVDFIDPGPLRTRLRATAFPGALPEETAPPESAVPAILARFASARAG